MQIFKLRYNFILISGSDSKLNVIKKNKNLN